VSDNVAFSSDFRTDGNEIRHCSGEESPRVQITVVQTLSYVLHAVWNKLTVADKSDRKQTTLLQQGLLETPSATGLGFHSTTSIRAPIYRVSNEVTYNFSSFDVKLSS